jgi:hypothetical protein
VWRIGGVVCGNESKAWELLEFVVVVVNGYEKGRKNSYCCYYYC